MLYFESRCKKICHCSKNLICCIFLHPHKINIFINRANSLGPGQTALYGAPSLNWDPYYFAILASNVLQQRQCMCLYSTVAIYGKTDLSFKLSDYSRTNCILMKLNNVTQCVKLSLKLKLGTRLGGLLGVGYM